MSDDECADGVTLLAGRGRCRRRQDGGRDHGWAAIWATAKERGGSSNGAGARAAACLGGDPGDGDFAQTGGRHGDGVDVLGFRVVSFFPPTTVDANVETCGRTTATYGDGCGYAGGRVYSDGCGIRGRAYDVARDVRCRVGIPIPNVKLPYYPLYVLGGCTEALPKEI